MDSEAKTCKISKILELTMQCVFIEREQNLEFHIFKLLKLALINLLTLYAKTAKTIKLFFQKSLNYEIFKFCMQKPLKL